MNLNLGVTELIIDRVEDEVNNKFSVWMMQFVRSSGDSRRAAKKILGWENLAFATCAERKRRKVSMNESSKKTKQ